MIYQQLNVQPGKIAIVRERVAETVGETGIARPVGDFSESADWKTRTNPWALVVSVGPERILESGRTLTTNVEKGDKVCVAQIGMSIPLTSPDGQVEQIWIIPFEAIGAILVYACASCEWTGKQAPAGDICPQCPSIVRATLADMPK